MEFKGVKIIKVCFRDENSARTIANLKKSDIFHIAAQKLDCGYSLEPPRRGGSNEYPQSLFISKIRQIMYTPVNPSFTI